VCALISEFGCNPQVRCFEGRVLLHYACDGGVGNILFIDVNGNLFASVSLSDGMKIRVGKLGAARKSFIFS